MTSRRIVCFGEILMRLSEPGPGAEFTSPVLAWHVGGAEANVAAGLACLGHQAVAVSALPRSPLGEAAARALRARGVDLSGCLWRDAGRLGLYFHAAGAGARPGRITYDRRDSVFAATPADAFLTAQALDGSDWLHVSGVTPAVGPDAAEAACRAAETAAERGIGVSFDFNHRAQMWASWGGDPKPYLHRLVSAATIVLANDYDLANVIDVPADQRGRSLAFAPQAFEAFPRLRALASAYRSVASVESQALRAELVTRSGRWTTPEAKIEGIVDRIGGGDAFASGLISAWLRDAPEQDVLDEALAASVLAHYTPGDMPAHTAAELRDYTPNAGADVRR